jgi:NAD(P)-dependent dehydrogenase (short-subunit alcohol dehydrogenase family)
VSGKTCVITGANSGIGKAASIGLAKIGARVVMISRDLAKGEKSRKDVAAAAGKNEEDIGLIQADLTSLDSVRSLAAKLLENNAPLHVLINNAGLILGSRTVTKDGFETTFQVNYLSHFLLTNLVLERMKQNAPSRIINTTSRNHASGHMHFDDLQLEKGYSGLKSYDQSKLAQVLFTTELARRLQGTGVTVNCFHPGFVRSNWAMHSNGLYGVWVRIGQVFATSPKNGADTAVYLASSPEVANVTGKYFKKRRARNTSREAMDEAAAKRLWDFSMQMSGLAQMPIVR